MGNLLPASILVTGTNYKIRIYISATEHLCPSGTIILHCMYTTTTAYLYTSHKA